MEEDWDLSAIVRSCSSTIKPVATSNTNNINIENDNSKNPLRCLDSLSFGDDEGDLFSFPNLVQPRNNGLEELEDSYKPFLATTSCGQGNIPTSSISDFGVSSGQNQPQLVQQKQQYQPPTINITISPPFNTNQQQPQHVQQHPNQWQQLQPLPGTNTSVLPLRTMQAQTSAKPRKK